VVRRTQGEPELLSRCYRNSLEIALNEQLRSIAFPAISCGVYGYPIEEAATIAVREVRAFLDAYDLPERVVLVALDETTCDVLTTKLAKSENHR
jgi:O-acetyl-ADP-ribose deacetylase (regulator of RNase III)